LQHKIVNNIDSTTEVNIDSNTEVNMDTMDSNTNINSTNTSIPTANHLTDLADSKFMN
jgi:hypothetical protein